MSRRHRPVVFPGDRPVIEVYCTDRGRHQPFHVGRLVDGRARPWRLTAEAIEAHGTIIELAGGDPGPPPEPYICHGFVMFAGRWVPPSIRPDGGHTLTFRCLTCGRAPEVREDRLGTIVDRWRSSGLARFDVSYLD